MIENIYSFIYFVTCSNCNKLILSIFTKYDPCATDKKKLFNIKIILFLKTIQEFFLLFLSCSLLIRRYKLKTKKKKKNIFYNTRT